MSNEITLKGFKVARFMSEETLAFQARVYFQGKLIGEAQNDGHGGATHIYRCAGCDAKAYTAAERWAREQPDQTLDMGDGRTHTYQRSLDEWVDQVAGEMDIENMLRASFKRGLKKLVILDGGKVYTLTARDKTKTHTDEFKAAVLKRYPQAQILNNLPAEQAFKLWRGAVQS